MKIKIFDDILTGTARSSWKVFQKIVLEGRANYAAKLFW